MDIRNVGTNGNSNVERTGDRSKRTAGLPTVVIPSVARDEASISSTGRDTAAAIEVLAERARADDSSRQQRIEAARSRLLSGELDGELAFRGAARAVLDARFLTG